MNPAVNPALRTKSTILIVDDEDFARETLFSLLMGFDYELLLASNGFEALDLARAYLPDLVLLDIMMPEMDGYTVCEEMRRDPNLADIPVIMITALEGRKARLRGIEAGADDFIPKPYDRMELQARVRTVTRLNRYRRIQTERVKFDWVVERADQGYLILDDSGQIQYMNAQARLLLGWEGRSNPSDPPVFLDLARTQYQFEPVENWSAWPMPAPPGIPRYLVRPETENSLAFWLMVDSVDLPAGAGGGILVQLSSVTEQINMVREHHTFHSLIHHRMRTPITVMMGGLELLMMDLAGDPTLVSAVESMQEGARQLKDEIETILTYLDSPRKSRLEPGMSLTDLQEITDAGTGYLQIRPVRWSLPPDLGHLRLELGPRFIEMIMLELLLNARKFHPQHDPTVTIEIGLPDPNFVQVQIMDDGIHLTPQQLIQVWNPYAPSDRAVVDESTPVGLGLSTVASIIWSVGGSCHLSNRRDKPGVVVNLFIPVAHFHA
jgi:CheY-like chemotaxis protein